MDNMIKFRVISLDVWGGDEEGTYEKNNFYNLGTIEVNEMDEDIKDSMINALIEADILVPECRSMIYIVDNYGNGDYYEILDKETDRPLLDLQQITIEINV
jgi:hypothetical protein